MRTRKGGKMPEEKQRREGAAKGYEQELKQVHDLHERLLGTEKKSLQDAIAIGEVLDRIKAGVGHGNWGTWAKANLKFEVRTATNYMKVHTAHKSGALKGVNGLSEAYKHLMGVTDVHENGPKGKVRGRMVDSLPAVKLTARNPAEIETSVKAIGKGRDVICSVEICSTDAEDLKKKLQAIAYRLAEKIFAGQGGVIFVSVKS